MRTTIRMNEELARRAKQYARRNDRTFTQVIEEAVMRLLADGAKPAQRKPIILPTVGDPNHPVTEEQYRRAIGEMYEDEAKRLIEGYRAPDRR